MIISPDEVLKIALAEEGYLEKSKTAYALNKDIIYDKTAGAGSDNITKFGYEMHKIEPKVMDFPAKWCDAFVDWCFMKAFGIDIAKNLLCGNFDDYTINSANLYKKANQWVNSNPLVGDQIFFKNTVRICHTGLVYKVDKRYIYTIEGNTSNKGLLVPNGGGVAKKVYLHTYVGIAGFGRPKYEVRGACALGDQNPDVVELQKRLMAKGYPLPKYGVDGQYGEETFRAVKQFRVDNDLRSSGVCDAECWLKLMK